MLLFDQMIYLLCTRSKGGVESYVVLAQQCMASLMIPKR